MDSAPIVYFLEKHPKLASIFRPLFAAHAAGQVQFVITTTSIAEVLTGPLQNADEALVERYRAVLESWQVVDLNADIALAAGEFSASRIDSIRSRVSAARTLSVTLA